ncbi:hypothetical protein K438DRAFT_1876473 [Mycena galopus ATCC 62051]|nr:hypothetical protein K438DRAFT_1876473 [Mycena galopus ATCC 62051]
MPKQKKYTVRARVPVPGPIRRPTRASAERRLFNWPSDTMLDFDTPITTLLWLRNDEVPIQLVLYPRDDLRVRLSDHQIALRTVGFEEQNIPRPRRYYCDHEDGPTWVRCSWDTPLRVAGPGDTILLKHKDVDSERDFAVHEPHLKNTDVFTSSEPRYTETSVELRLSYYASNQLLDFNTQVLVLIWLKSDEFPLQMILYPREDLRVRLADHLSVLRGVGVNPEVPYMLRHSYQDDYGSWTRCGWDTPLKVSAPGDVLLIAVPGLTRYKAMQLYEPHL